MSDKFLCEGFSRTDDEICGEQLGGLNFRNLVDAISEEADCRQTCHGNDQRQADQAQFSCAPIPDQLGK